MTMFEFVPTKEMNVDVFDEQKSQISSKERIKSEIATNKKILAFNIVWQEKIVGFAMLREFEKGHYFLWDYCIDKSFQNKGLGTEALKELVAFLKKQYDCKEITTTYIWGNDHAKHLYEKIGFEQTDIVEENDIHEVNMALEL